jgi:hypothetical protein
VHLPSSPSSEDAGTDSLLLEAGTVSLLEELTMFSDEPGVAEEAGAALELETSPALDSGVSLDTGATELDDPTSAELELNFSSAELDTGAILEEERSGDCAELDRACSEELSVTEASVPELESSPQATRAAVKSAHKKTST